jgi:hypothetical protein
MTNYLQQIANDLAASGVCRDFWDVELEMIARGHSAADARRTTADTKTREELNQRCMMAKLRPRRRAFLHVAS